MTDTQEIFNRGYLAAITQALHNTPRGKQIDVEKLFADGMDTQPVSDEFRRGWQTYCNEIMAEQYRTAEQRSPKGRLILVLTWAIFAAAVALVGLYAWGYYLHQADRAAEERRLAELSSRVQWLGNMTTYRYWPSDHDPRGNLLAMENRQIEIGLKPDGTVVWRKLSAAKASK